MAHVPEYAHTFKFVSIDLYPEVRKGIQLFTGIKGTLSLK